ncbi:uncharacterized protein LOC109726422 [Ananas comosus]|uniref:Uncharacterized protein LOC109726422 n=1 Tax=Ananas comosus TaxID=4615 RepID=A0A6P5GUT1_ANACO|nr:uncharacterized protein LOC109726422 [Ananas comosus]
METLRSRVESWIKDQAERMGATWPPPPLLPRWRWPRPPPWRWGGGDEGGGGGGGKGRREAERRIREEYERRRGQLRELCGAVKVDSVADLQEVLCSMVLSECVYKRPASEMIRYINKFKSDFGGQIVSLERVQPSLDHVPHRYLLAEAGDTLFATFIGTKQYKDLITDVNIFQGAIFHEDNSEDFDLVDIGESDQNGIQKKSEENLGKPVQEKPKRLKTSKPAAHRGFLARAKGIPALELYKLAQKKNRKLVLCGHSLGGAVAALATLAILRVLASSTLSKENGKVQVKCITFSQPPVGNSALRDYVHQKGWENYFKTYCIPEDLVPRILSPAYFHHYNTQTMQTSSDENLNGAKLEETTSGPSLKMPKEDNGQQLVLGVGPVQTSMWRLAKLVPLEAVRNQFNIFRRNQNKVGEASLDIDSGLQSKGDESEAEPQSLEIQEGSEGITLAPLPDTDQETLGNHVERRSRLDDEDSRRWHRLPNLPSYVPFGQLYLLGDLSVKSLSDAEYSKMTSVRSVITELKERFQSHSMKSYRSRFQKIYDLCMCVNASPFMGVEQLPHLQQLLGLAAADSVELGNIVEPPVIRTATSIVPLGWNGVSGDKNTDPLKVDIVGHGLHLCSLVQAQVNGNWCSTAVESLPSAPPYSSNHEAEPNLQKMRVLIGAPLKRSPKFPVAEDSLFPIYPPVVECSNSTPECESRSFFQDRRRCCDGLDGFVIYCTTDFTTVCKEVHVRTRRVRLLGFEGAGKTSLFRAMLQFRQRNNGNIESICPYMDAQEGVAGGLCYADSAGVNLQELNSEAIKFREELQMGLRDLAKKTDLIILVHNLSQKIPRYHHPNASKPQPALSLLLNEAKALNIPYVLALTNRFSVSAHQQNTLIASAMEAYEASADTTQVINSSPFFIASNASAVQPMTSANELSGRKEAGSPRSVFAPLSLSLLPLQRRAGVMPIEGVGAFRGLVHRVLRSNEEMAFQELVEERLSLELAKEKQVLTDAMHEPQKKSGSISAAAVGASLGAGLGLVMAVVMGAASALRKP